LNVDQPATDETGRSFFKFFSFADRSPEEILVRTILGTAALLVGAALFDHTPLPMIPAALLFCGWRAYLTRRAHG
jgi:hypothetical protein